MIRIDKILLNAAANLLDTNALEGLLDLQEDSSTPLRKRNQLLDTRQIFDSLVEVGTLEALVSQRPKSAAKSNRPILGTQLYSSLGSMLDTSEIAGHMLGLKGALRAIIWLFKSDQPAAGSVFLPFLLSPLLPIFPAHSYTSGRIAQIIRACSASSQRSEGCETCYGLSIMSLTYIRIRVGELIRINQSGSS